MSTEAPGRRLRFRTVANTAGGFIPSVACQIEDAETGEVLPFRRLTFGFFPEGWLKANVAFAEGPEVEVYLTAISWEGVILSEPAGGDGADREEARRTSPVSSSPPSP